MYKVYGSTVATPCFADWSIFNDTVLQDFSAENNNF